MSRIANCGPTVMNAESCYIDNVGYSIIMASTRPLCFGGMLGTVERVRQVDPVAG